MLLNGLSHFLWQPASVPQLRGTLPQAPAIRLPGRQDLRVVSACALPRQSNMCSDEVPAAKAVNHLRLSDKDL